ncbi:N-terminal acetyltransferase [Entophlyctis luteolus]|nr:N-terminal acetyltransferase [Entophlyctis luteolus]KAJ3350922.1 N-terminal acetyltransferase [Entophlyctis luteolus]KAJ3388965.1 N-terminal acetyltransferase [Entophlyctis sp. JEL0112]
MSEYTLEQVRLYEEVVSLPLRFRKESNPNLDIDYLTALHQYQICAIPFENLQMHYSPTRAISLDPQVLFAKMVTDKRGRGGYCMECTTLFYHILKAVGFDVYRAGARTRKRVNGIPEGNYTGWSHSVNIVTFPSGERYMLDVAFGGGGPTKPVPMISGMAVENLGPQEVRLLHAPLPQQTTASQKLWHYQLRNAPDMEWLSYYSFSDIEFYQPDFETMSYFISKAGATFLSQQIVVVKFVKGHDDSHIAGKITLAAGDVRRYVEGKTHLVQTCHTEEERVRALEEHFGIMLIGEEVTGIEGSVASL